MLFFTGFIAMLSGCFFYERSFLVNEFWGLEQEIREMEW